jgi:c-di-GMP-binding flagellar brake protein YcgR
MTDQPQEMSQKDRRKHPRIKAVVSVEFKPEGAPVASGAETIDLSLSGCYVEMSFTLAVGTKLDLILWIDGQKIVTKAVVVSNTPQFGNGIEFIEMAQEDQDKLAHFLKSLETPAEEKPEASASG